MAGVVASTPLDVAASIDEFIRDSVTNVEFFRADKATGRIGLGSRAVPGSAPQTLLHAGVDDANFGSAVEVARIEHSVTGLAAAGIGAYISAFLEFTSGAILEYGRAQFSSQEPGIGNDGQFSVFTRKAATLPGADMVERFRVNGGSGTGGSTASLFRFRSRRTDGTEEDMIRITNVTDGSNWGRIVFMRDGTNHGSVTALGSNGEVGFESGVGNFMLAIKTSGINALTVLGGESNGAVVGAAPLHAYRDVASTSTILEMLRLERLTTGLAAAGIGARRTSFLENAAGISVEAFREDVSFLDVTAASEDSRWSLYTRLAGVVTERLRSDDSFYLDVLGDTRVQGKLTVTGAIDPTDITLSGGTAQFMQYGAGSTAGLSAPSTGRFRYNEGTQRFEVSENAGAYEDLLTTANVGWIDDGTVVRLVTASDQVGIGTASPAAGTKVHILQDTVATGGIVESLRIERQTTGVAVNGIGSSQRFFAEDDAGNAIETFRIESQLDIVAAANPRSRVGFYQKNATAAISERMVFESSGSIDQVDLKPTSGNLLAVRFAPIANTGVIVQLFDTAAALASQIVPVASNRLDFRDGSGVGIMSLFTNQVRIGNNGAPAATLHVVRDVADNSSVLEISRLERTTTSGAFGAVGIGARSTVFLENNVGTSLEAVRQDYSLEDVVAGSEDSKWSFYTLIDGVLGERMRYGAATGAQRKLFVAGNGFAVTPSGLSGGALELFSGGTTRLYLASSTGPSVGSWSWDGTHHFFEKDAATGAAMLINLSGTRAKVMIGTSAAAPATTLHLRDTAPAMRWQDETAVTGRTLDIDYTSGVMTIRDVTGAVNELQMDVVNNEFIPATDNTWSVGTAARRFSLVRAVTVTSGAYLEEEHFAEEELPLKERLRALKRELEFGGDRNLAKIALFAASLIAEFLESN